MQEKLEVTQDLVFQRIFGKVGNERITKPFLEKMLGIKIKKLSLDTNKRLIGETIENKVGRIDVKARLDDGTKVIVEMQVINHSYMAERILYYWAGAYAEELKQGKGYENLKKTIVILISVDNLKITEGIKRYHTKWEIKEEEEPRYKFSEALEIHVIELKKYPNGEGEESDWIKFIKEGPRMVDLKKFEEEVQEAIKELNYLEQDPEMKELAQSKRYELYDKVTILNEVKEAKRGLDKTKRKLEGIKRELDDTEQRLEGKEQELEGTKQKLEGTKQKLEGTKQKLEGTKQKLEGTKQQLKGTKQKLEGSKQKLEGTKRELNNVKQELKRITEKEEKKQKEIIINMYVRRHR